MTFRILLIDDTLSSEQIGGQFANAGLEAIFATDLAGVSRVLGAPLAAIVVDPRTPESLGDELLEFLREGRGVQAPVVLFSDSDEESLAAKAESVDAAEHVRKCDGIGRLTEVLRSICEQRLAPVPKRRVMVVDDSEMTGKLIEAELSEKHFEVILADSVDKATRLMLKKQTRPQLVLLDVWMPNVDGVHFCRFIKNNSLFQGIKVVLCSGMAVEKLKLITAACGADGYVLKDTFLSKWVLAQIEAEERSQSVAPIR